MVKRLGKVGVLMGGRSAEREVSLRSGNGVLEALRRKGVDAHGFDTGKQNLAQLAGENFDRVFIALHGRYGEDGTMQGALEQMQIPYTGPGVMASAIAMDKAMTKRIWLAQGLPTPKFEMLTSESNREKIIGTLGLPLIIKAAHEGSSLGLSKIVQQDQLQRAYAQASKFDMDVIAEEFIDGMELTCAILEINGQPEALPVVRIVAPGANYDYRTKYFGKETQYLCPSELPPDQELQVRALALESYRAIGCRGWARADVMVRKSDNKPFLLEINTSPGMTDHSLVPMAAKAAGIGYEDLCLQILRAAKLDMTPSNDWKPD
jgi:D-alanine-D-alanine ligase